MIEGRAGDEVAGTDGEFIFENFTPATLRRRGSIKWSRYEPDVLACWVAEMDFPAAPPVRRAVLEAVEREQFGYPTDDDRNGLPEVVAAFCERRFGWKPEPERIHSVPDVLRGVELAVRHYSPEGSAIVLPTPAYMPFFDFPAVTHRPLIEVPMGLVHGAFRLDFDGIEAAFSRGAGTIILCHPYNPLGRSFTPDELRQLSQIVDRHGARVVSDEIHAPLTYPGQSHLPYASLSEHAAAHTVTVTSASKAWNLPGLKCAQVVTSNRVDENRWRAIPALEKQGASTLGVAANVAAYRDGEPWLDAALSYLDGNRRLLADLIAAHLPKVRFHPPEATYLAWLDCRELRLDVEPADHFLAAARVATNPGLAFGVNGAGHLRFNFATSRYILVRAIEAMGAATPA
jgi:cystathionine beta-lyase